MIVRPNILIQNCLRIRYERNKLTLERFMGLDRASNMVLGKKLSNRIAKKFCAKGCIVDNSVVATAGDKGMRAYACLLHVCVCVCMYICVTTV